MASQWRCRSTWKSASGCTSYGSAVKKLITKRALRYMKETLDFTSCTLVSFVVLALFSKCHVLDILDRSSQELCSQTPEFLN